MQTSIPIAILDNWTEAAVATKIPTDQRGAAVTVMRTRQRQLRAAAADTMTDESAIRRTANEQLSAGHGAYEHMQIGEHGIKFNQYSGWSNLS